MLQYVASSGPSNFAVGIFEEHRTEAVAKFTGASMETIGAAFREIDTSLSKTVPGSECARRVKDLAVYDVLKKEAAKHGIDNLRGYVDRWM